MADIWILIGMAVASSFLATLGIAKTFGRNVPLTDSERVRLEVDDILNRLGPDEVQQLLRVARKLDRNQLGDEGPKSGTIPRSTRIAS